MTDRKNITWIPPSLQKCKKTAMLEQRMSPLSVWCPENDSIHLDRKVVETRCKCNCQEPFQTSSHSANGFWATESAAKLQGRLTCPGIVGLLL
jgi:hypothetical protein